MSDKDGMAPGLTPEDREWARRANAEMQRRQRENIYAPRPEIREKMDSMAPGIVVTRPATEPPVPLPSGDSEPDTDTRTDTDE
jgi:hypothetical protein